MSEPKSEHDDMEPVAPIETKGGEQPFPPEQDAPDKRGTSFAPRMAHKPSSV